MNACIAAVSGILSKFVKSKTGEKLYVSSAIWNKAHQQTFYEEDLGDGFLKSQAGQMVNSYCDEYGFIIRYPS